MRTKSHLFELSRRPVLALLHRHGIPDLPSFFCATRWRRVLLDGLAVSINGVCFAAARMHLS
jgi:hypothetical protein